MTDRLVQKQVHYSGVILTNLRSLQSQSLTSTFSMKNSSRRDNALVEFDEFQPWSSFIVASSNLVAHLNTFFL